MTILLKSDRLAALWIACLLCGTARSPAQLVVQIGQNFTGNTFGVNAQSLPPDSNGAVGPRHFMEFINGAVSVYNKTNGVSVQRKSDLKFWSDAGLIISPDSTTSDPRVIYDPSVQRWFASQVQFSTSSDDPTLEANDFLIAVSATSDPTGRWKAFSFQADPDTGYFADFPTLGLDSNAVYLSGDLYQGEENPIGPCLVSIPKVDLLASTPTVDNRTWFGVMSYDDRGQVLQPAICFDGSSTGNILAMGDIGTDSEPHTNIFSFAVQNAASPGAATLTAGTSIEVTPYVVPDNPDQGVPMFNPVQSDGTTRLAANDARLSANVYAVNGVLYAVHSTEVGGRIAIRWYRISASNHTLLESGTIADANLDLFFPSIAANASGTVMIACNGSSINTYVSSYAIPGTTDQGVTSFGPPILLQGGVTEYHGLDEWLAELLEEPPLSRWGDYSAISVDPADPNRFWTIQMYPSDTDESGIGVWSTQITELITAYPARLSITRSGSQAMVSWPVTSTGFQLESRTDFAADWTPITQNLSTNNGLVSFQPALATGASFFRLRKP